jgi:dienelactone hydrolase
MRRCSVGLLMLTGAAGIASAQAQDTSEKLRFRETYRGKAIIVGGELRLPPGSAKVPALVIHHGSGGVSESREWRYAREILKMGVATFVLDSFTPRGVTSTVTDQSTVTAGDMLIDDFETLKALAKHPRIDAQRVGIVGFSKGASSALAAAIEIRASRALPPGLRYALHVLFYPSCGSQYYKPKTTGAPIYLLLGAADTYVGTAPCQEYVAALQAEAARIELTLYPHAKHGFDGTQDYTVPDGENYSRCVFAQQPDGSWKERISGITAFGVYGQIFQAEYKKALGACRTYGVSGGPDADAKAKSMAALKSYVQQHLLDGK